MNRLHWAGLGLSAVLVPGMIVDSATANEKTPNHEVQEYVTPDCYQQFGEFPVNAEVAAELCLRKSMAKQGMGPYVEPAEELESADDSHVIHLVGGGILLLSGMTVGLYGYHVRQARKNQPSISEFSNSIEDEATAIEGMSTQVFNIYWAGYNSRKLSKKSDPGS